MPKTRLTPAQRADRRERRAIARTEKANKVAAIHAWIDEREQVALAKFEKAKKAQAEKKEKAAAAETLKVTETPYTFSKTTDRKPGRKLAHGASSVFSSPTGTVAGNYATRRAAGQRGKRRSLRLREMPVASQRRVHLARNEWMTALGQPAQYVGLAIDVTKVSPRNEKSAPVKMSDVA